LHALGRQPTRGANRRRHRPQGDLPSTV